MSSPGEIYLSDMFLLSGLLNAMTFGGLAVLFLGIMHQFWARMISSSGRPRHQYKTWIFIVLLFATNTVYMVTTILSTENTYIYNVAYPGGGTIYYITNVMDYTTVILVNQIAFVVGSILADGFLLLRTRAIFKAAGSKYSQLCLVPGVLLLLLSLVLLTIFTIDLLVPASPLALVMSVNWIAIYFLSSFVFNFYLTLLISLRIFIFQRNTRKTVPGRYAELYGTFSTMFIESAVMYSVVALGAAATFNSYSSLVWQSIALPIQSMSSFLITYRIAQGRSWETETAENRDSLESDGQPMRGRTRPIDENEVLDISFESKAVELGHSPQSGAPWYYRPGGGAVESV